MKANTFIIIVTAYTAILGVLSLFFPSMALSYFAGKPDDLEQASLMNFIGVYQIALAFIGYTISKTNESVSRKAWLLMVAFLTITAIILTIYNKSVRMIPVGDTHWVDWLIWAAIAAGALFFRSKE
jgi:hypothetical protein